MAASRLPDWVVLDKCKIVKYYPYPSFNRGVLFNYDSQHQEDHSEFDMAFFKSVADDLVTNYLFEDTKTTVMMVNKVVLEVEIDGYRLFVGYKDNSYSLGLSAYQKDGREPYTLIKKD